MPQIQDSSMCQQKHDEIRMFAVPIQNYQQINSKLYSIFQKNFGQISVKTSSDKVLIKKRVLNDYLNIVNKRGDIIAKVKADYKKMCVTKDENIYYFCRYYNEAHMNELEELFASLGPQYKFGTAIFKNSAENIRKKVLMAGDHIFKRKEQEKENKKKEILEKQKRKKEQKIDFAQSLQDMELQQQQQKNLRAEDRMQRIKGYANDTEDVDDARKDLMQLTEISKFGSDRIKLKMFEEDMKKILQEEEKKEKAKSSKTFSTFLKKKNLPSQNSQSAQNSQSNKQSNDDTKNSNNNNLFTNFTQATQFDLQPIQEEDQAINTFRSESRGSIGSNKSIEENDHIIDNNQYYLINLQTEENQNQKQKANSQSQHQQNFQTAQDSSFNEQFDKEYFYKTFQAQQKDNIFQTSQSVQNIPFTLNQYQKQNSSNANKIQLQSQQLIKQQPEYSSLPPSKNQMPSKITSFIHTSNDNTTVPSSPADNNSKQSQQLQIQQQQLSNEVHRKFLKSEGANYNNYQQQNDNDSSNQGKQLLQQITAKTPNYQRRKNSSQDQQENQQQLQQNFFKLFEQQSQLKGSRTSKMLDSQQLNAGETNSFQSLSRQSHYRAQSTQVSQGSQQETQIQNRNAKSQERKSKMLNSFQVQQFQRRVQVMGGKLSQARFSIGSGMTKLDFVDHIKNINKVTIDYADSSSESEMASKNGEEDDLNNSQNSLETKQKNLYQQKQIELHKTKAMNDVYIEKYYNQKLLGMQKNQAPIYSSDQIEQIIKNRESRLKKNEYNLVKSKFLKQNKNNSMQFQIQNDNTQIKKQFGNKILQQYEEIQNSCQSIILKNKFQGQQIKTQKRNVLEQFKDINGKFRKELGTKVIKFWNMEDTQFKKLQNQYLSTKFQKINEKKNQVQIEQNIKEQKELELQQQQKLEKEKELTLQKESYSNQLDEINNTDMFSYNNNEADQEKIKNQGDVSQQKQLENSKNLTDEQLIEQYNNKIQDKREKLALWRKEDRKLNSINWQIDSNLHISQDPDYDEEEQSPVVKTNKLKITKRKQKKNNSLDKPTNVQNLSSHAKQK